MNKNEIEKLKKELEFYKGIVNKAKVAIHISEIVDDKYFKVIWANKYYIEDCGFDIEKRNKNVKKYYKEYYTSADRITTANVIKEMRKTGKDYSGIYKLYLPDKNERKWAYSNLRPYKYNKDGILTQVLLVSVFLTRKNYNPERIEDLQKEVLQLKHKLTLSKLSKAEIIILQLLASGKSEKEIANVQSRSTHTIKTHLKNIRSKLNFNKNTELVKFAIETGIG
jgi:DNA-binding CsgD family transcriptional regulator